MEITKETPEQLEHIKVDPEVLKKDPDASIWKTWQGAVLLKDEIKRYCTGPIKMIAPFEDSRKFLKSASYHLRLGSYYRKDGKDYEMYPNKK